MGWGLVDYPLLETRGNNVITNRCCFNLRKLGFGKRQGIGVCEGGDAIFMLQLLSCSSGRLPFPAGLGMTSRADISMVRNMNCAYLSRMMCLFARIGIFIMRVSGRAGG